VFYILDEPSIGLHQRDKTNSFLEQLRDLGNSVIVVEHDKDMIER
jgi:excinuclease ABC subunit A